MNLNENLGTENKFCASFDSGLNAVVRSTALFIEPTDQPLSERSFTALNDNNAAQFSKNTGTVLTIKDENAPVTVRYSLTQFMPEDRERIVVQEETTATATVYPPFVAPAAPDEFRKHRVCLGQQRNNCDRLFPAIDLAFETRTIHSPYSHFRQRYGNREQRIFHPLEGYAVVVV